MTPAQANVLGVIAYELGKHGVCPSYVDIAARLQLRSKTQVHYAVVALEEQGFIERLPHRARALRLTAKGEAIRPLVFDTPVGTLRWVLPYGSTTGQRFTAPSRHHQQPLTR